MKKFAICLQYLIPHHLLSRLVGSIMHCRHPYIKNRLIRWFIRRYAVDMNQALQSDPTAYPDFNHFFTRALKAELRPISDQPQAVICPVDGTISQLGDIKGKRIFQAKGFDFDLETLLGGSHERARPFRDGRFITLYLAPKDYHRIHMPIAGTLREMIYVPGRLFSVNPSTAATIPQLFARNERVIALFDTAVGPMAMVLVGAMIVASISTIWHGVVTPPRGRKVVSWTYNQPNQAPIALARGAEMGHFKLGSTVLVLFGPQAVHWASGLAPMQTVQFGNLLGETLISHS